MITRRELLSSKEYWIGRTQNKLYEEVKRYIAENDINQTKLAEELNVGKSYISQVLKGDFDHKLSKFIELSLHIGKIPDVRFVDIEAYLKKDEENYISAAIEKYIESLGEINISNSGEIDPLYGKGVKRGRIINIKSVKEKTISYSKTAHFQPIAIGQ